MSRKSKNTKQQSQRDLLLEYFKNHPKRNIKHPEVVDWAVSTWQKRTGKVFRDPDRGIRSLYQTGVLVKVAKGVYRYEPKNSRQPRKSAAFTAAQKSKILKRDGYKCLICGRGKKEGLELHVDHIKPLDKGGTATIKNGQTLCSEHNILKQNYSQTEFGKRFFIKLHKQALHAEDEFMLCFANDILAIYAKHGLDKHIKT